MIQASSSLKLALAGAAVAIGLAALIGCAVGTTPGADISQLDSLPVEAGGPPGEDSSTTVLPPSTRPTDTTGDDAGTDAAVAEDAAVMVDAGTDAATGVDSGTGGGGVSCASPNVCTGATDLGTISGDTGADVKTASGAGSHWFTIRVNENDSGITGRSMLTKAELVSPPGTTFDVFIYVAGGTSGQECSAVKASSTNASGLDTAKAEWGETGLFSNGADDSRTVSVEVRWISGTCSTSAPWTLTVRGNSP